MRRTDRFRLPIDSIYAPDTAAHKPAAWRPFAMRAAVVSSKDLPAIGFAVAQSGIQDPIARIPGDGAIGLELPDAFGNICCHSDTAPHHTATLQFVPGFGTSVSLGWRQRSFRTKNAPFLSVAVTSPPRSHTACECELAKANLADRASREQWSGPGCVRARACPVCRKLQAHSLGPNPPRSAPMGAGGADGPAVELLTGHQRRD